MIISDQNHGTMKLEPSDEVLKELYRLRAENEKLRAALKPFASVEPDEFEYAPSIFKNDHIRAAAAALKETE